jgi:hypothetical protein
MKSDINLKKEIYMAIGFSLLMLGLAYPLFILGMKLLNYIFGNIPL